MKIEKLPKENTNRQAELTRTLIEASKAYYGSGNAVMSDIEFDRL